MSVRATPPALEPVPRAALTLDEAAASLGMSRSHFDRHVKPELRIVRSGNVRVVPTAEVFKFAEKQARLA